MRRCAVILAAFVLCSLMFVCAQEQEESTQPSPRAKKTASQPLLARNVVVPIKDVKQFFPAVTRQLEADADADALAKPRATRKVIYATRDGAQKVTLSVDDYAYGSQALLAYQEATQKTQLPAFEPIAIANIGQQVFAGALKQDGETQIVITTVIDTLLVTATLTGYEDTTENISKLADLARLEVDEAQAHARTRRRL